MARFPTPSSAIRSHPNYGGDAWQAEQDRTWDAWQAQLRAQPAHPYIPEMPKFDMSALLEQQRAQQQSYADAIRKQQEAAERQAGIANRDELYSARQSAASTAVDYINQRISEERANAALLGLDFDITDEVKQTRINNYFATLWGAGDEERLEGLFNRWGTPKGFEEFNIQRGDGGSAEAGPEASEGDTTVSTTGRRRTIIDEDEDDTLDNATILGGA